MSNLKPLSQSETNTLLTTLTQRRKEVKVYRYEDLGSKDVQKAIGENGGSAWLIVGESKKWIWSISRSLSVTSDETNS